MEQPRPKGKLRNKVFFTIALVSILPILIVGFLSVYGITVSHRVDVANLETAVLDQKYGEIKDFVDRVIRDVGVQVASGAKDLDPLLKKATLSAINTHSEINEIAWLDLEGHETVKLNRLHPDGVPDSDLENLSSDGSFLAAKEGNSYISPVRITPDGPEVVVAYPVKNKDKDIIAVTRGVVSFKDIQVIVGNASIGNSGYVYMVDGTGAFLGGNIGITPLANLKGVGIVSGVVGGESFLGPEKQSRYKNYFGDDVVAAGEYIPELKAGLVAEWPTQEADASVNDLIYKNAIVTLAVFFAVIIASILLATLIVRPIRVLEGGTRLVAQGKFDQVVEIRTGDELEELGIAFNKMIAGLKQLDELKDEFVFIAAHELRTPVAAMKGYLSLVLDGVTGPLADKTKEFIQKVIASNQRLIQLVNDLLEVSRSEAGKLTIKVSQIDIVQPIKEALGELRPLADKQSISLAYEPPPDTPKIMADADRIKEIVVNLVGNAIKYNNDGGWVRVSHEVKNGEFITHVADNGFGVSPEAQKKLFEKFYRVATEKTRDITGTGLGLFIVKEIIEKMNGKIWAESEGEGKGSAFSFSLPLAA